MSLDERMRTGVWEATASHPINTPTAWEEVRMEAQSQTRRNVVLMGVAAAVVVILGLVWGPGLLNAIGGDTDMAPAGPSEEPAGAAAAVLAEYQAARNVDTVSEDQAPEGWLDSLMSLYAEDAVVTGHPRDRSDPPVATGQEEIQRLELGFALDEPRAAEATQYFDVAATDEQATFRTHVFDKYGDCFGGSSLDEITVEDGKITRYAWGEGADQPCDAAQLAQAYPDGTTVEFSGDQCTYSGPTEFHLGDRFDVTAVDTSNSDVGFAVDKVVDGSTVADAQEALADPRLDGAEELTDGQPGQGTYLWSTFKAPGAQRYMSTTLDAAGTWLLYCFLPSEGQQVYATTFEVVE